MILQKNDKIKQSKRNQNIENVSRITGINEASRRTYTG
jgi:GTP-binding protein EngB required for normal cell division